LLLYPDRVAHVDAKMQHFGLLPFFVIVVLCRWIASRRAPKQVAAGAASVVSIPLATVRQVEIETLRPGQDTSLLGHTLVILTTDGAAYRFTGLRCDKWLADLGTAVSGTGRHLSPTTAGFAVS
jgi:hypothetical protein